MQNIRPPYETTRSGLMKQEQKGEFWKPCPGTTGGYLCCGYQILTPMTGCGMYCRYCILQSYFDHEYRILFENFDDLKREVDEKMAVWKGVVRFGTGEFADSLHAEEQTGVSVAIAELLDRYPQVVVEFKTKSAVTAPLRKIKRPEKVIIGYSLNPPEMIRVMEEGTASLDERLTAAGRCLEMGFNVAFHFDPIFWYDGWEREYRKVVDRIYEVVKDTSRIAWCSLGGFRTAPSLKSYLRERGEYLSLFSGEMITGADGKLRYFRPLRVAIYRAMQEAFFRHQEDAPVYYCMESREVWEETGLLRRIPDGLPAYLDGRARAILSRVSSR